MILIGLICLLSQINFFSDYSRQDYWRGSTVIALFLKESHLPSRDLSWHTSWSSSLDVAQRSQVNNKH